MQWSLGRLFFLLVFGSLNGLLLSMSCASDLASAPGAPKGDARVNDLETLNKCLSDEAPNIQVGVYQDRFIPTDEDNQLSVRSDLMVD